MREISPANGKMQQTDKFIGFFTYSLKKLLMYRVYIISKAIGGLVIPVVLQFFLWRSILRANSVGYDLTGMMRYIVISNAILLFTQIHAEHEIERDIKTYGLGQKLLLPVGYFIGIALRHFPTAVAKFVIIYLPVIAGISIFVGGRPQPLIKYYVLKHLNFPAVCATPLLICLNLYCLRLCNAPVTIGYAFPFYAA